MTISTLLYAQSNGTVGINTTNPNASAVLDVVSNPSGTGSDKGLLVPRMTTAQSPCPEGFRLPTKQEWVDEFAAEGINSLATAAILI